MALAAARSKVLLLGTCVPCLKHNASKILVKKMELDENLLAYFRKDEYHFAYDPEKICKTGDIVLIEKLPGKLSTSQTFKVLQVVYPLGDITDPISGQKVVAGLYRDEIDERISRFGRLKTAFNYKEAAERGSQEDKRDFTHRQSYIKYNVFDDDNQPYAI